MNFHCFSEHTLAESAILSKVPVKAISCDGVAAPKSKRGRKRKYKTPLEQMMSTNSMRPISQYFHSQVPAGEKQQLDGQTVKVSTFERLASPRYELRLVGGMLLKISRYYALWICNNGDWWLLQTVAQKWKEAHDLPARATGLAYSPTGETRWF